MDSEIFTSRIKQLDRTIIAGEGNIALIMDKFPTQPHVEGLEAIELLFLLLNTTLRLQPMDQGVIRTLKAKYRSAIVNLFTI